MTRFLIRLELFLIFCFAVVGGACIADTAERRGQEAEARAIMVVLMSHSLKELGEIHTKQI